MHPLQLSFRKHLLKFNFEAGTSRGVLTQRYTYYLALKGNHAVGIGEASPLQGLSVDWLANFETLLCHFVEQFNKQKFEQGQEQAINWVFENTKQLPSVRFGMETAMADLQNGGKRQIFNTPFFEGKRAIPINGLVWMGTERFMLEQIEQKLAEGFKCLKLKIGAINFEQELNLLKHIRQRFSPEQIVLRVDANGAFSPTEALEKLHRLAPLGIHSIEQPIRQGQGQAMHQLCRNSPVPIALDEELIGISTPQAQAQLLDLIRPQYIILKPTLLGGFAQTAQWIALAEARQIPWWITSALESNIGLNAICQFTDTYQNPLPQGLGTGKLYQNNIASPLVVQNGYIEYQPHVAWAEHE